MYTIKNTGKHQSTCNQSLPVKVFWLVVEDDGVGEVGDDGVGDDTEEQSQ